MSINGVNQNTDIQKLLKLMKSNKGANVGMSKKVDARMTKEGSIFAKTVSSTSNNKSNVASTNNNVQARTIGNVQSANVAKSISNVSATSIVCSLSFDIFIVLLSDNSLSLFGITLSSGNNIM